MATFRGGEKLQRALEDIARRLGRGGELRVGFFANATYPDGTPVAAVAFWNNFGTGTIPPRPFFSNMITAKSPEWPRAIAGLLQVHRCDVDRVLQITGHAIAGQLKQSIIDTNTPPNAPSTIRKKGFNKPLIETSHMINSVDFEVIR